MAEYRASIDSLIIGLMLIDNFNKDIHYHAHGEAFYSKHIFVDKFSFSEEIDKLKEIALLGLSLRPLPSATYLSLAGKTQAQPDEMNDKANFEKLIKLIDEALNLINEKIDTKNNKGIENLIGGIAEKLMQYKGLLNLQIE